jgi:hypothetical protein
MVACKGDSSLFADHLINEAVSKLSIIWKLPSEAMSNS